MNKIRVGLLLDELVVSAWAARMLELVIRDEGVEIVLLVKNAAPRGKSGMAGHRPLLSRLMSGLGKKLVARLLRDQHDAFQSVDVTAMLAGIPSLEVTACENAGKEEFRLSDIERIESFGADVLIKLGFGALRGPILHAASCGVWACRHADRHGGRMPANALREVLSGELVTESVLTMLSDAPAGDAVLLRSWSANEAVSPGRGLNVAYWKTASFIPRKLHELRRSGRDAFMEKHAHRAERLAHGDTEVDDVTVLMKLPLLLASKLHRNIRRRFFRDQWILLYHSEKTGWQTEDLAEFRQLVPPGDRFWADPFVVEYEGRRAIFIEELEYANNTGYLSVINIDSDGNPVLPPVPILKKPYHLSYPHVFEDDGTLYMVPETRQNGTIELYRAARFPDKWEFVMNLMENICAVDTTIWKHGGKYWMFANVAENKGASTCDELFLFHSDSLLSRDWHPHPCNPVVSDARRARPAGRIFERNGHWYRPSQDCSGAYGRAIEIQRIEHIDEASYLETPAGRIDADWDKEIVCTHTLTEAGGITCIDGLKVRKRTRPLRQAAGRHARAWFRAEKRKRLRSAGSHTG